MTTAEERPAAPADPQATVERLTRAINAHDLEAFVDCFAPDYASEQPAHPDRAYRGQDQLRKNWARIFASIPDLRADLRGVAVVGETVWSEWVWTGTQETGAPFDWCGVILFGVRGGQITWGRLYMEAVERAGAGIDAAVRRMTGPIASAGPGA
jgi:ketosteroid isomerase-like protein